LELLRAQVEPTPTAALRPHEVALDIGVAANHSTYDTLYVAFSVAMAADRLVTADRSFAQAMRTHPDPVLARMILPLGEWAAAAEITC
jgi:predicted nucleic acid-binding protein